jgi:hypothetical protein
MPLGREIMAMCCQCDYDVDDPELQKLAWLLYAGTHTTKNNLENVFAHLTDKAARTTKNKKMGDWTKWFYTVSSPYSAAGGQQQLFPEDADWVTSLGPAMSKERNGLNNLFKIGSSPLPTIPDADGKQVPISGQRLIKSKWQKSGPISHQRGAAAIMYLLQDAPHDFVNASKAWAGLAVCLFVWLCGCLLVCCGGRNLYHASNLFKAVCLRHSV